MRERASRAGKAKSPPAPRGRDGQRTTTDDTKEMTPMKSPSVEIDSNPSPPTVALDDGGTEFVEVARLADLEPEVPLRVEVGGTALLLVRVNHEVFAVAATCTHETAPLDDGFVEDGAIECPRHGARFDLRSGAALSLPATRGLGRHAVRLQHGRVLVATDPTA
jgi:3-phenylpropionate/trans-cinnamate dioxygenase ferredoxin subunit